MSRRGDILWTGIMCAVWAWATADDLVHRARRRWRTIGAPEW